MLIVLPWLLSCLQQAKPSEAPRLVVMVVVDQLIPEQLQRLAPHLSGGFGRFLKEGAVFWRATVDYANTETGPGTRRSRRAAIQRAPASSRTRSSTARSSRSSTASATRTRIR